MICVKSLTFHCIWLIMDKRENQSWKGTTCIKNLLILHKQKKQAFPGHHCLPHCTHKYHAEMEMENIHFIKSRNTKQRKKRVWERINFHAVPVVYHYKKWYSTDLVRSVRAGTLVEWKWKPLCLCSSIIAKVSRVEYSLLFRTFIKA